MKIYKLRENQNLQDELESNTFFKESINQLEKEFQSFFKNNNFNFDLDINLTIDDGLDKNLDHYPPCMRYLLNSFKETSYLKHNYRFQIGLFLKRLGMDVHTQLRFWYEGAVDNAGITFETFEKRAGYIIRHIYGLEGSRTDYQVPSCKKIMTDYFCLFTHVNSNELRKSIPLLYKTFDNTKDSNILDEIVNLSLNNINRACSLLFESLFKSPIKIFHPLIWTKTSLKILNVDNSSN